MERLFLKQVQAVLLTHATGELRRGEEMNIWVSNVTVLDKNLNYWVQNEKFLKELLLSVLS